MRDAVVLHILAIDIVFRLVDSLFNELLTQVEPCSRDDFPVDIFGNFLFDEQRALLLVSGQDLSELLFLTFLGQAFKGALRLVGRGLSESFNLILSGLIFGIFIRLSLNIIFKFLWLWRWFDQQRIFDCLTLAPLLLLGGEDLLDRPGLPLLLLQLVQDSLQAARDLRPVQPDLSLRHA